MNKKTYTPDPIDTASIELPEDLQVLVEHLARHVHDVWAQKRIEQGWTWGSKRDDDKKLHPDLIPYDQLSEEEKEYDRQTAKETLKVVLQLGYKIEKGK
jgi:ryanodine receptor 2